MTTIHSSFPWPVKFLVVSYNNTLSVYILDCDNYENSVAMLQVNIQAGYQ